jgi:hypothetical protein
VKVNWYQCHNGIEELRSDKDLGQD